MIHFSRIQNTISIDSYFKTTKKYLHHLLPLERRLFLYDVESNRSILYPLIGSDVDIPLFPTTVITPDLDLYILGGLHPKSHEYVNTMLKYDKIQGLMTSSKLMERKIAFGVCYISGLIYIFGGKTRENERIDLCERYSIKTNKWEPIQRMKEKRASPGVCSFRDEDIYVFFGAENRESQTEAIEKYNVKVNSWVSIHPINWLEGFERSQITCHQINENQIILFGGVNRIESDENKKEKIYRFCSRMVLFDVAYKNFENWGNILPDGSLNLGQSFVENKTLYSLRTLPKSHENQFESGFAVMRITENMEISYINIINCKDVRTIMELQKQKEKIE